MYTTANDFKRSFTHTHTQHDGENFFFFNFQEQEITPKMNKRYEEMIKEQRIEKKNLNDLAKKNASYCRKARKKIIISYSDLYNHNNLKMAELFLSFFLPSHIFFFLREFFCISPFLYFFWLYSLVVVIKLSIEIWTTNTELKA